ncbi:MAG: hypothetical protein AMXMBFR36_12770 [Acidobacteriota bacterium]
MSSLAGPAWLSGGDERDRVRIHDPIEVPPMEVPPDSCEIGAPVDVHREV